MISRRFGVPIILGGASGNAASISTLVVLVAVGAIPLGFLSNADVLALYSLVGKRLVGDIVEILRIRKFY